ncbi:MAG: hypothetical protein Q7T18_00785 [Sedimentisphaerales bacterium]|nr:hypothetical protein [Sedimentisphaerales bacterium]
MGIAIEKTWQQERVLNTAFDECRVCLETVFKNAGDILHTPEGTPIEFEVRLGAVPNEFYEIRKNLFSTLFQSVYHLLKIEKERRLLYGTLNYLFRIWVTSADNLLDNEDKIVVPMEMNGSSRVMRQVVSIMLADRVLNKIIDNAVAKGVITEHDALSLSNKSLQILLPSAAEEASEEGGITRRPDADYVLNTIHRLKTGLLFRIPFLGPDNIEKNINKESLALCKDGLMSFGIGCQILDDIRDISKDYLEKRHNYILSKIYSDDPIYLAKLSEIENAIDGSSNIFEMFPEVVHPAADKAMGLLSDGLLMLSDAGLGVGKQMARVLALSMFNVLGVGELTQCLSV